MRTAFIVLLACALLSVVPFFVFAPASVLGVLA